nr:hypothetical protein BOSE7B_60640 [Bosea sp. 7B]
MQAIDDRLCAYGRDALRPQIIPQTRESRSGKDIISQIDRDNGGDGGIRTLDTLVGYAHLANECLQPLGHVSVGRLYARSRPALTSRQDKRSTDIPQIASIRAVSIATSTIDALDPGHRLVERREDRARHLRILGLAQAEADAIAVRLAPNRDQRWPGVGLGGSEGIGDWHGHFPFGRSHQSFRHLNGFRTARSGERTVIARSVSDEAIPGRQRSTPSWIASLRSQ